MMSRKPWLAVVLAAWSLVCAGAEDPWRLDEWPFRHVVEIVSPDPSGEINTALAEVDTGGKLRADGSDLRVVEAASGRGAKYRVLSVANGVARVEFLVSDPKALRYHIYYGASKARAEKHEWPRKVGELTLTVYKNALKQPGRNWRHMKQLLRHSQDKVGRIARLRIDDVTNPLGKPDDYYIGVYKGKLFCRETGVYSFATNSDDSSFLLIDGSLVASLPGAHDPIARFDTKGGRGGRLRLKRGIHTVEYYHVECTGDQLARAGWRPPWGKALRTIPAEAYIRELRTQSIARQARDRGLSAYFNFRVTDAAQFRGTGATFVTVAFTGRVTSRLGKPTLWQWDFGDGTTGSGPDPSHQYSKAGTYRVRLRCVDHLGYRDTCERRVAADSADPRRCEALLEAAPADAILKPTQPLNMTVRYRGAGTGRLPCVLAMELKTLDGRVLWRRRESVTLRPKLWGVAERAMKTKGMPLRLVAETRLELDGRALSRRVTRVEPPEMVSADLKVDNGALVNSRGERVVFRLSPEVKARPMRSFRKRLARGRSVKVCIVDDSLAPMGGGASAATYFAVMRDLLRKRFPGVPVDVTRLSVNSLSHYDPLRRLARIPRQVALRNPDMVVVAVSLRDLQNNLDPARQELLLYALVDRLRGVSSAEIVLVTPPPVILNPGRSKEYAKRTIRVALKRGLKLANVYNTFARLGREACERLFQDPDEPDVVYLYPNLKGQRLIGECLTRAALE